MTVDIAHSLPDSRATGPVPFPPAAAGPLRILIVSDAWQPQVNGVVRTYENLNARLRAAGDEVQVIGPVAFPGVALPSYPEIPLALPYYRRLAGMIEDFAPDAIHIPVEGPLGWMARHWCRANRVPFSTAFHTDFPAYVALRSPGALRSAAGAMTVAAMRRFHAPAHHVYVATAALEDKLRNWGFDNRFVRLSRGVDLGLFHPDPPRPETSEPPVLLYVGRLAPEKNIEAFLALPGPARKVVVGDGPLLPALRQRHPEVDFRGTLTGQTLADAYRAADVFVFPSRTDTFGIVVIEALACGIPVAAYPALGPREIVGADPRLGAIDEDLTAAVARALAAPGSRADRHDHVRAHYSWDEAARVFARHCAELAR
ncbi:glycosyltransferase family 1 protein [Rhodovulum tesquicola]|uniref:glycosyltransferase family 4 protein n=1 Tax=Rhodovulum tesquicola TaxID=540254 RepID=UPI002097A6BB|nr:glycosyltransferase family 1 protein [Rhodovulum tesquicola]